MGKSVSQDLTGTQRGEYAELQQGWLKEETKDAPVWNMLEARKRGRLFVYPPGGMMSCYTGIIGWSYHRGILRALAAPNQDGFADEEIVTSCPFLLESYPESEDVPSAEMQN